jgi:hypothetical protein
MEPGHCAQGSRLYDLYYNNSVDWATGEVNGRTARSKPGYEKARCAYIEHVVECKDCAWDVLAFAYLDGIEPAVRASAVCALD